MNKRWMMTAPLISLALFASSVASARGCQEYLVAANVYEELVSGQIKKKFSVFEIPNWSESSAYQLILAKKATPDDATLKVDFQSSATVVQTTPAGSAKSKRKGAAVSTTTVDANGGSVTVSSSTSASSTSTTTTTSGGTTTTTSNQVAASTSARTAVGGFEKWPMDLNYRACKVKVSDLIPNGTEAGTLTFTLSSKGKVLCTETRAVLPAE